ncbi:hypothetical protein BpHYR1_053581, partial [Brachionus plicatilis]
YFFFYIFFPGKFYIFFYRFLNSVNSFLLQNRKQNENFESIISNTEFPRLIMLHYKLGHAN